MRASRVALLSFAVSGAIAVTPAFADGGLGGSAPANSGGSDNTTTGGNGGNGAAAGTGVGGSGGGAGFKGGDGGSGGSSGLAAQGGQTPGTAGQQGSSSSTDGISAGGGGGGAHGGGGTLLPLDSTPITGGGGGVGGNANAGILDSGGGGGGAGGYGFVLTDTALGQTLNADLTGGRGGRGGEAQSNNSSGGDGGSGGDGLHAVGAAAPTIASQVTGGRGGDGGSVLGGIASSSSGNGGNGGNGGVGFMMDGVGGISGEDVTVSGTVKGGDGGKGGGVTNFEPSSGHGGNGGNGGAGMSMRGATIVVNAGGEVTGGKGGAAGAGSSNGSVAGVIGLGGAGITGENLTVINAGSISGGLAGDSTTQANAITFSGGINIYEIANPNAAVGGNVVDQTKNGTFRLGGDTSGNFNVEQLTTIDMGGPYQGFKHLDKTGDSIWTLTGNGTSVQDITVSEGQLQVNGSLGSVTATVKKDAILYGTGELGAVTVNAGGTFNPGSHGPTASMKVASLAMETGALYYVWLNPTQSSSTNVTGTATLGGATVSARFGAGDYVEKQYTILKAGSISGTFNSVVQNDSLPSGFKTSLSYNTEKTEAYLNLNLDIMPPSGPSGSTQSGANTNQGNVASAVTNYSKTHPDIPVAFGALTTPQALTQVSGEVGTSAQGTTAQANTQFMNVMGDVTSAGRGFAAGAGGVGGAMGYADEANSASMAYAGKSKSKDARDAFASFNKAPSRALFDPRWSVWAMGFGGSQTTDGNATAGTNTASSNIYGMAVGADYRFGPDTVAGFALAGGGTNYSIVNGGTGRSDLFQAGAFVRQNFGATYLTASAAYGWQDVKTDRYVTAFGVDHLKAEFNTNSYSGRLELGHRYLMPWFGGLGVSPYAAAEVTAFELPSYAEHAVSGAGTFALNYNGQTATSTRSELGVRTDKSYALEGAMLTLRGRAAWAHNFDPDSAVTATFQTLPGASFLVNGAKLAADSALTTASAELSWANGWSVAGTFEGEFSNVTRSYAGKGVVRYSW